MIRVFEVGIGAGLIAVALAAQWLISKRLKNQKVSKIYSWIAWCLAVLGGVGITTGFGDAMGIGAGGAGIASLIMLLFIGVDIADRRPDWTAFILICLTPSFMRLSGGTLGQIYDGILTPFDGILSGFRSFLGM
ncbi:hypothetical protein AB0B94_30810 [Micromonospora sp. NPDC048986]|uniref:hypothetical protein n=1 Tax=Micromonospora sp. NPDC048986 TaxID=3155644 RepID=UPI0033E5ED05